MAIIDLGEPVRRGTIEIGAEHDEERTARLRREERSHLYAEVKAAFLFVVVLAGLAVIAGACLWLGGFAAGVDAETRRWSQTVLVAVVSGSVSFLLGRATGR